MFFAAVLHVVLVRFRKDETIVRDLVQLNSAGAVGTEDQERLTCVRNAVWGMLYADGAGIVSKSAEGFATSMTAIVVVVFEATRLAVSEKKTETTLLRTPDRPNSPRPTARHQKCRPEAKIDGPVLIPWRHYRRKC